MEQNKALPEQETDVHGKQIMYDIFSCRRVKPMRHAFAHTHTYFEVLLINKGVAVDLAASPPPPPPPHDIGGCRICHTERSA